MARSGQREYLIEMRRVGDYIKVAAIDPVTNTEVSIVGSARATERQLQRVAVRKLEYVLNKKAKGKAG